MYKVKLLYASLFILFFVMMYQNNFGQVYGKLYTESEGEHLYGKVVKSFQISTAKVLSFLNQTDKVLMFNINDNKLIILGDSRKPIYPVSAVVSNKEVFRVYSTSLIKELISKGKSDLINFEKRNIVLTISNGGYMLEFAQICPPFCP